MDKSVTYFVRETSGEASVLLEPNRIDLLEHRARTFQTLLKMNHPSIHSPKEASGFLQRTFTQAQPTQSPYTHSLSLPRLPSPIQSKQKKH